MRLHKVYHRFSSSSFIIQHQFNRFSLSLPSSSLSSFPFKFPGIRTSQQLRTVSGKPFSSTMSRLQSLAPVEAVSGENIAAAPSNGSASNSQLEDDLGTNGGYQLPPSEIRDIVDAPPLPALSVSPHRDKILFLKRRSLPPLIDLAKPEEKLAGIRIDGKSNTRSRMSFYTGIGIHQLTSDGTLGPGKEVHGLPDGARINFVSWKKLPHIDFFNRHNLWSYSTEV